MRRAWLLGLCVVLLTAWPGAAQIRLFGGGTSPASGGGVGIDGTPTANQLAYWTNAATIGGTSSLSVQITDLNLTGATRTAPNKAGTAPPGTCAVGDTFFDTDATAGANLFGCTSTDTWTGLGGGGSSFTSPVTITSTSANALAVGAAGTTNPALQIDASTASAATGIKVISKALGAGVELTSLGTANEGLSLQTLGNSVLTLNTGGTGGTVRFLVGGSNKFNLTNGLTTSSQSTLLPVPAAQTLTAGATITDNACGGLKRLSSASDVTTGTTHTLTAPGASNTGCIMHLYNTGAFIITLDNNSNFRGKGNADMLLGPEDALVVGSDGTIWRPLTDIVAN